MLRSLIFWILIWNSCLGQLRKRQDYTIQNGDIHSVKWPSGLYGLPRPLTGCPKGWKEGLRYQDTENHLSSNYVSPSYRMSGKVTAHGIRTEFCIKDSDESGNGEIIEWPSGQYCIYKYGPVCPQGLTEGWVFWDDEDNELIDGGNIYRGYVPAGIYEMDTLIYFCCHQEGDKRIPIVLPTEVPFLLLAYDTPECQRVAGASVTTEFVQWDDEDRANTNDHSAVVPFGVDLDPMNTRMYFCYYDTGSCGPVGASCQNSTVEDSAEGKSVLDGGKSKRSRIPRSPYLKVSTMALTVAGSAAAAMFGTASVVVLIRHFTRKGQENLPEPNPSVVDDDIPRPDVM